MPLLLYYKFAYSGQLPELMPTLKKKMTQWLLISLKFSKFTPFNCNKGFFLVKLHVNVTLIFRYPTAKGTIRSTSENQTIQDQTDSEFSVTRYKIMEL